MTVALCVLWFIVGLAVGFQWAAYRAVLWLFKCEGLATHVMTCQTCAINPPAKEGDRG
jgi:hypothetical protein